MFMGRFGQVVNSVALVFALVGSGHLIRYRSVLAALVLACHDSSFLVRKMGLRFCLVASPFGCLIVLAAVYLYSSLWVLFVG